MICGNAVHAADDQNPEGICIDMTLDKGMDTEAKTVGTLALTSVGNGRLTVSTCSAGDDL